MIPVQPCKQVPALLQIHRPAVVLVAVGGSDVDPDWRKTILSNGKRNRSRVSLEDYEKNLRGIVAAAQAARARPILTEGTSSCIEMRGVYFSRISGLDVVSMVAAGGGQETNDRRVEHYRQAVRRIAAELNVDIVASPHGLASEDPHVIFTEDGVHLSAVAHRMLAAAYAQRSAARSIFATIRPSRNLCRAILILRSGAAAALTSFCLPKLYRSDKFIVIASPSYPPNRTMNDRLDLLQRRRPHGPAIDKNQEATHDWTSRNICTQCGNPRCTPRCGCAGPGSRAGRCCRPVPGRGDAQANEQACRACHRRSVGPAS